MTLLSIVVPSHNYGHFSDRLFGSIAAQTMSLAQVEILFMDDASTDDSVVRARKWASRIDCARFVVEQLPRQGHPAPVRNHGLSLAKGKYLLSVDPDDELAPDYLDRSITTLENDPNITGVYPDYFEVTPEASTRVRLPKFNQGLLRMQNIIPVTAIYRREVWDVGARYRHNTAYEDWDYWVQAVQRGARFKHLPEPLFTYHFHQANFSYQAAQNDGPAKAAIVANNPGFFHPLVEEWARDYQRGRLHSQAFQRGHIPAPNDVKALLKTVEQTVLAAGF